MNQQDMSRKLINLSIMLAAVLYIVICYILIISEGYSILDFRIPFITLVSAVAVTEFISFLIVKKSWKLEEGENLQEVLTKDIVKLAIAHVISLFGLIYFLISFAG